MDREKAAAVAEIGEELEALHRLRGRLPRYLGAAEPRNCASSSTTPTRRSTSSRTASPSARPGTPAPPTSTSTSSGPTALTRPAVTRSWRRRRSPASSRSTAMPTYKGWAHGRCGAQRRAVRRDLAPPRRGRAPRPACRPRREPADRRRRTLNQLIQGLTLRSSARSPSRASSGEMLPPSRPPRRRLRLPRPRPHPSRRRGGRAGGRHRAPPRRQLSRLPPRRSGRRGDRGRADEETDSEPARS